MTSFPVQPFFLWQKENMEIKLFVLRPKDSTSNAWRDNYICHLCLLLSIQYSYIVDLYQHLSRSFRKQNPTILKIDQIQMSWAPHVPHARIMIDLICLHKIKLPWLGGGLSLSTMRTFMLHVQFLFFFLKKKINN